MNRLSLYVTTILLVSIILRLYPTYLTGLPFSTDSWPLISNAEKLIEFTPTPLDSDVFDGYNSYWPLSQVYGAVSSIILSATPLDCMRVLIPSAASLSPLIIYIIVRRLSNNVFLGFVAGLLFAAGGPHVILTAGVTKESFTNILFLESLYFFSLQSGVASLTGFSILSLALIMSHHLTYVVLIVVLVNIFLAEVFLPRLRSGKIVERVVMLTVLIIAGLFYYVFYALRGLKVTLSFSDWLSAFSFQVVLFIGMFYVLARPASRRILMLWIAIVLGAFTGLLINQVRPFIPGAPRLSPSVFLYSCVIIFLGFLVAMGLYSVKKTEMDEKFYPLLFWLSSLLGLEAYAIFGADPSLSLTLTYRLPNFLIPVMASAAGASALDKSRSQLSRAAFFTCFIFLAGAMAMQSYSAVVLQENYVGYQWLYLPQDLEQTLWIKKYGEGLTIYGDLKISYLAKDYFGLKVNSAEGYALLTGDRVGSLNGLLLTYPAMEKNGYLLGPYGVELPQEWKNKLSGERYLIYSSSSNLIYLI